ncbi:hypothetical protein DXG03_004364 [Asterophora parasitica]|uniref:Major facilitator superfamily (MFS) profile domain-containing protein n=1 Tax=Asterophora parasitica TaxID=117018 RepID=A0A9P7KEQ4_9AGAR|nr:hypothetical protein DXG03_004364 [Asterophora parasitica]
MSFTEKDSRDGSIGAQKANNNAHSLDKRRRAALAEIDNAKFSWFHVKVCLVAGAGFFTDAYDIFAINIASTMLGYVYGTGSPLNKSGQKLNKRQDLGVKVATPVGTLVGQLLFGWLADVVGRKRMYGVELMIIIIGTFAQALSGGGHAVGIIGVLVVWRFLMGIGIGGDYPLSAVISSEFASTRIRGRMMTAVFAAQGWGNLSAFSTYSKYFTMRILVVIPAAALVALIITVAFKNSILNDPSVDNPRHVDYMWRILIGLGCVPGCIALYFRLTIPETPRFTMDIERNVAQASADIDNVVINGQLTVNPDAAVQRSDAPKASWADFREHFSQWKNLKILIGTAWSWFALDVAFYGLGLNSSIVLQAIGFGTPLTKGTQLVYRNLKNIAVGNLILSAGGLLPGYYFTFLFIDRWGRKPIQLMGFILLTIIFIVMGFGYDKLTANPAAKKGFVVLYCFANFFQNFGPNTTTFLPETKNKSLEELSNEDQDNFVTGHSEPVKGQYEA